MQTKCSYCGCLFENYDTRRQYCSDECKRLARNERRAEAKALKRGEVSSAAGVRHKAGDDAYCVRWKKSENMIALEKLAKEAYDNGMNYGQYVAKKSK